MPAGQEGVTLELRKMQHKTITRYDVEALVDNELAWDDAQDVMRHLEKDSSLSAYCEQLQIQKKLLLEWWADTQTD